MKYDRRNEFSYLGNYLHTAQRFPGTSSGQMHLAPYSCGLDVRPRARIPGAAEKMVRVIHTSNDIAYVRTATETGPIPREEDLWRGSFVLSLAKILVTSSETSFFSAGAKFNDGICTYGQAIFLLSTSRQ